MSTTVQLRIITPGLSTTIQDLGRFGSQRLGVPPAGVLDREALRIANALVGNADTAAALEVRALGPTIEAVEGPVVCAFVGCGVQMRRLPAENTSNQAGVAHQTSGTNPSTIADGQTITLAPGERLDVGALHDGQVGVLAVAGGIDVCEVLGSRATYMRGGMGGFEGRAVRAGDDLPVGTATGVDAASRSLNPVGLREPYRVPALSADAPLRVLLGPQDDHFTPDALEQLTTAHWTVTNDADRMGVRLQGPALAHLGSPNIVSDGIATGALQVPGSGQPIVLLADRQTTGGYPKIATVISADLPRIAQAAPGTVFRFAVVTSDAASQIAREARAATDRIIRSIAPLSMTPDTAALLANNLISGVWPKDQPSVGKQARKE